MFLKKRILISCPRYWQHVRGYKLHERRISYMSLNQDSKCNANCQGCFRYPNRKDGIGNLLTMADYEHLISEFAQTGGLALEISGEGEAMLSENTLPIIRLASSLGLWTTLITSDHLITKEVIMELSQLQVALVISLHSLKKEAYEQDCGMPCSFEEKMKIINLVSHHFSKLIQHENGKKVMRAAIHWTLQANNANEVVEARRFCTDHNLLFSIAPLARTGHATNRPELWLPADATLQEINEMGDESIIFYDEPDGRMVCGTCKYGLNIGADGNLLLDAHGGYEVNIANIRDISFEEAIDLQHQFSQKMFKELNCFCPVRDPNWQNFLDKKKYLPT